MSAPVTVHLLRHGEPAMAGRMLGHTDADATPAGVAACVAQAADLAPAAIVSSDLIRAARCAAAIAGARPVTHDPRWRELDFGAWDGLATAAIDADALGRFWRDPDRNPPPGGERWSALVDRVGGALATCADETLVVTHAGAMRAALSVACGFTVAQGWAFHLPYAALLTLRMWPDGAQIVRLRA